MRFHASTISRVSQFKNRASLRFNPLRSFDQRCNFGIAFDIDGVILRGRVPVGGSRQVLRRLYGDSGELIVPYLFLTNGGGIPETKQANELSELLGVNIMASQVVQGHSPFKNLLKKFENELIVATGKGDHALLSILVLEKFCHWMSLHLTLRELILYLNIKDRKTPTVPRYDVSLERIKAAFVVSDPVDWGRDIQVLCDVLRFGGLPGDANGKQPPLYFAADDLEY
ncbi:hypothetical protein DITRI_Ditri09bG0113900 [Diplodiscus trichospermus]